MGHGPPCQKLRTERARAESAFRAVFESSPIGIALHDESGRIVDLNEAMVALQEAKAPRVGLMSDPKPREDAK